ncbi:MAG: FHA domain-containing protein [Planctomycetaceae bacterium]|nr:FHA domain-containing protein [Planctomycetaceae bacterium]
MRARLFPVESTGHLTPIVVDTFPIFLGIGDDARLQVSECPSHTRRCQISLENGTLVAIDLDSPDGTWVNGESIERAPLMPGDKLLIGTRTLVISYERLTRRPPPDVFYRWNAVGNSEAKQVSQ